MVSNLFGWIIRIAVTILIFIVVYTGIPWAAHFVGLSIPDDFMKAVAALVALLFLLSDYRSGWTGRWTGPRA